MEGEREGENTSPMRLTIIPVAHVSKKSAELVHKTILEENPEVVGLELCRERLASLSARERRGMDIRTAISHPTSAFLYLAQQALGKFWRITPGSEMVAALRAAALSNKPVLLLDRPIRLTARELEKIPLGEKLGMLFWDIPLGRKKGVKLEHLMDPAALRPLLSSMKEKFPKSYEVFVESRNRYMLAMLLKRNPQSAVIVVGAAHSEGIKELAEQSGAKMEITIKRY
ncbi:TraB/GumN family protein [Candidatus Micrarchaeota archaeon]|nr:TraB/GumN family protein [Candidatus Micrarchaeota archaeon]